MSRTAIQLLSSGVHQAEETGQVIIAGISEAVEQLGEIRTRNYGEQLETYFDSVAESDQVVVMCNTGTHPDPLLRRLGVIEGRGFYRGMEVYFHPTKGCWVTKYDNKKVEHLVRGEVSVKFRTDRIPKGVLHVCGSLLDADDTDSDRKGKASQLVRRIKETKARVTNTEEGLPSKPELEGDDEYYRQLSSPEHQVIFKQYLSSGVVEAAKRSESCIITHGTGHIASCLSESVDVTQNKGVGGGYPTTGIRSDKTLLIGVTRYGPTFTKEILDKKFTHHIVVDRDTRPVRESPHEIPFITSPVDEMRGKEKDEAQRRTTETINKEMGIHTYSTYLKKTPTCRGFRCRHVDLNYKPIVHDGRRAKHCRIDSVHNVTQNEATSEKETTEERTARFQQENQRFVDRVGADLWTNVCMRVCECGHPLEPFEVAQCICGMYDFEHVSREAKRIRYHNLKKHFDDSQAPNKDAIITYLAFMQHPVSREPSLRESHRFVDGVLATLARGFASETDLARNTLSAPPNRPAVPVVTILFGGDFHVDKLLIARHVQKRWPIVVVEGSGGYADMLCSVVAKVREIAASQTHGDPNKKVAVKKGKAVISEAGIDEYRRFLTTIDSLTAEIIINGRLTIIHKGTKTSEFSRKLEITLSGNETLEKTWLLYSQWLTNADIQRARYFTFRWIINVLSLLTTALSVVQSFLLLIQFSEPLALPTEGSFVSILQTSIVWVVIVLPIVISFIQAVSVKDQAGTKSVLLGNASEKLLSEIYMYRTNTVAYSTTELQRQLERLSNGPLDEADKAYSTREELLQMRCTELTNGLSQSEVAGATLKPYTGPLPPRVIRRAGDDGLSDLSPDKYIKVRLEARTKMLEAKTRIDGATIVTANFFINTANAAGTFCAALAAYGFGFMQPWVAFTTALAVSITMWVDNTQVETLQKKLNISINNLHIVNSWWVSLGPSADTKKNRDRLVVDTETCILDEALRWNPTHAKHRKNGDEVQKRPDPKSNEATEGDKLGEMSTLHGVELQGFTIKGMLDAVKNPTSHSSQPVKQALLKLADLGLAPGDSSPRNVRDPLEYIQESPRVIRNSEEDQLRALKTPCIGATSSVEKEVLTVLHQPDARNKFLDGLLEGVKQRSLSRICIMAEIAKLPSLYELTSVYVTRKLLEVVKISCLEALSTYFTTGIQGFNHQDFYPEVNCCTSDEIVFMETFISEMHSLTRTEGVMQISPKALVNIIKDKEVKEKFRSWRIAVRNAMRDSADRLWTPNPLQPDKNQQTAQLLDTTLKIIARLDVNELLDLPNIRVSLWGKLPDLLRLSTTNKLMLLSKEQLIACFPEAMNKSLQKKSHLQIQKYIEILSLGTSSSRTFSYEHEKYDALLRNSDGKKIFHPTEGNQELRERLLIAVSELDQLIINRSSKGLLLKKLRVHDVFNEGCGELLLNVREQDLKFLMSVIQSRISNTYSSRLMDKVADEVLSFDVRSTITYYNAEKLITHITEFWEYESVSELSKMEILRMFGARSLVESLEHLSKAQLVDLVQTVLSATNRSFPIHMQMHLRTQLSEVFSNPKLKAAFEVWSPEFFETLSHKVSSVSIDSLIASSGTSMDVVARVSSSVTVVTGFKSLIDSCVVAGYPDATTKALLIQILSAIKEFSGEQLLSIAFENAVIFLRSRKERLPEGEKLLQIFEDSEKRVVATELLLTLPSLEVHELVIKGEKLVDLMHADPNNETQQSVLAKMKEVQNSDLALYGLLLELTVEASIRFFHAISDRCITFDLRDLVTGTTQRQGVVALLAELYLSNGAELFEARLTPAHGTQKIYDRTNAWLGRHPNEAVEAYPPGAWKQSFIDEATELREGYYYCLCDDLRVLTELQLKIVCEEFHLIMTDTVSGRFFAKYIEHSGRARDWAIWNSSTDALRQKSRTDPELVRTIFDNFDSKLFASKEETLKDHLLIPVLDRECDRDYISALTEDELRDKVFPYIGPSYGPTTKMTFIDLSHKLTRDAWGKLRKAHASMFAFKGTVRQ